MLRATHAVQRWEVVKESYTRPCDIRVALKETRVYFFKAEPVVLVDNFHKLGSSLCSVVH